MRVRRVPSFAIVVFLAAVTLVLPPGLGHAAPDAPEHMTRLLHDFNDDWGGHAGAADGHDIMALDLREAYNGTLGGRVLVFRLLLNAGHDGDDERPELREVVSFTAGGDRVERAFTTTDNRAFGGTWAHVSAPSPARKADGTPDGQRFFVEGTVPLEDLDLDVGDKLSGFSVQGFAGEAKADHMVGGYTLDGATTNAPSPSEQAEPASYRRGTYELQGPTMYVDSSVDPAAVTLQVVDNQTLSWVVENQLGAVQRVTVAAVVPEGIEVAFHSDRYAARQLSFPLPADGEALVHAYLTSFGQPSSGTARFALRTNLGGYEEHSVEVRRADDAAGEEGGLPVPGWAAVVALATAAALLRRRR